MDYEFKFKLKQPVEALDHDKPRKLHRGFVVRRYLQERLFHESDNHSADLEEYYEVLIGKQNCLFPVSDLREPQP